MRKKGRMIYLSPSILDEVEDIKREDKLKTRGEALRMMYKYSRVGREAKRIYTLDWSRVKPKKVKPRSKLWGGF